MKLDPESLTVDSFDVRQDDLLYSQVLVSAGPNAACDSLVDGQPCAA